MALVRQHWSPDCSVEHLAAPGTHALVVYGQQCGARVAELSFGGGPSVSKARELESLKMKDESFGRRAKTERV